MLKEMATMSELSPGKGYILADRDRQTSFGIWNGENLVWSDNYAYDISHSGLDISERVLEIPDWTTSKINAAGEFEFDMHIREVSGLKTLLICDNFDIYEMPMLDEHRRALFGDTQLNAESISAPRTSRIYRDPASFQAISDAANSSKYGVVKENIPR